MFNRETILEYTRRSGEKKHCIRRVYEAPVIGTSISNSIIYSFLDLTGLDITNSLSIMKDTLKNQNMKEFIFSDNDAQINQCLEGIKKAELKNKALIDVTIEALMRKFKISCDKVIVYYGNYEIPLKTVFGTGNPMINECETSQVYEHIVFSFIKNKKIVNGILFPALDSDRSSLMNAIDMF